jgi:tetratricopeptide (TPR) repeat protein
VFFRKKKVGAEYYFERGEECLRNNNVQWAIESYTKALEFDPGYEVAYLGRSDAYKMAGRTREAVLDLIKFLETDRRQPDMAEDLDDALREAVKIARRGWERDRVEAEIVSYGIPVLLDDLLKEYDPNKEYSDKRFYKLAFKWLDEESDRDGRHIGFVQVLRGRYDEALKELSRWVEAHPDDSDSHYLRGVACLGKMKDGRAGSRVRGEVGVPLHHLAHESFEQAVKADPRWRLCPVCGYRTVLQMIFCMHCGGRLLIGNRVKQQESI